MCVPNKVDLMTSYWIFLSACEQRCRDDKLQTVAESLEHEGAELQTFLLLHHGKVWRVNIEEVTERYGPSSETKHLNPRKHNL